MKRLLIVFLFSVILFSGQGQTSQNIYVGTFTSEGAEGIYLCSFNASTGKIQLEKTFKAIDNPSFLSISPDEEYLYAVSRTSTKIEKSGGYVLAYRINPNGELEFINKQLSHGTGPCHINVSADGKYVAIATYGGGTISVYPVKAGGGLLPASSTVQFKGSGPNKRRQEAPHGHSIKFSPFSSFVFSADLGTDQLNIFRLKDGKLVATEQQFVKLAPGAGPRHFDFHPEGNFIYLINELNSTVEVIENKMGTWQSIQTVSTLPSGFNGDNYCADIHVSADGKFVYGSNRGHNSISVFQVNPDSKKLTLVSTTSTQGEWPRNFTLSPEGKFLIAANQHSGNITVFQIDQESGELQFTGSQLEIPSPVCLEFLN